jgi:ATP/maltotriose-dependent transcriptional regulator MalT
LGLDAQRTTDLHQKALQWFEANGYLQEAIEHALLSENYIRLAS